MNNMLSNSHLVRVAESIREQLTVSRLSRLAEVERQIERLLSVVDRLGAVRRKLQMSRERGWTGAASRLFREVESLTRSVPSALADLEHSARRTRTQAPSLREVYLDLKQAQEEFGGLHYDGDNRAVSVITDPIELEGFPLGEFEIRLEIAGLADGRSVPYRVIALDPHTAASNEGVTHPHVSDERLCTGDAGAAIQAALTTGRVFDFFTLVRSVLVTYNPESPFVSLDNWHGVGCYECGYVMAQDDIRWCSLCEQDFCGECASYCSRCDETTCLGCLVPCSLCEESVCGRCMTTCPDCGRELCRTCVDEELCPCHEEEEENDESNTSQNEGVQENHQQGVGQQPQRGEDAVQRTQGASTGAVAVSAPRQAAAG